jgi:hypothetical protein
MGQQKKEGQGQNPVSLTFARMPRAEARGGHAGHRAAASSIPKNGIYASLRQAG